MRISLLTPAELQIVSEWSNTYIPDVGILS